MVMNIKLHKAFGKYYTQRRGVLGRQCSDKNRNIKGWCSADIESKL